MSRAVLCPVCDGTGEYEESLDLGTTSTIRKKRTCHGCGGIGWVTVE